MPERIQRKRTKGWRKPPQAIYVGRPTIYGNPWVLIAEEIVVCDINDEEWWVTEAAHNGGARQFAVDRFRAWIEQETLDPSKWPTQAIVAHFYLKGAFDRGDLAGRDLMCWCALDQPCHADVLLEIANRADTDQAGAEGAR